MKTYTLLFRGGMDYSAASPEDMQQSLAKWKDWIDGIAAAGKMAGGHRLGGDAAVLKGRPAMVTDGPFAEGKEVISGFIAVTGADLQEAIDMAKACPVFEHDNGSVEVREVATM